jgi:AcrR family transcriptional regulator
VTPTTRERILEGTLRCIEVDGLGSTSIEDVARASSVSRATIYRQFPGGREQLISEAITWEVAVFFHRIEVAIADETDLAGMVAGALRAGHEALADHGLLHQLLRTEPEAVLTELAVATDVVLGVIVALIAEQLGQEIVTGRARIDLDPTEAADHLGRLFLSYLGTPGRWDLTDPESLDRLVRTQFLAGIARRS